MMNNLVVNIENVSYPVLNLPNRPKALLDSTVAQIFGVETKHINQAVQRNRNKFPFDFYFELTNEETEHLSKLYGKVSLKRGHLPKAFSHLGCNMIATILKTDIAIRRSIQIVRIFTEWESTNHSSMAIEEVKEMIRLQNQVIIAINNKLHEMGIKHSKEIQDILNRIYQLENRTWINNLQKKIEVKTISLQQAELLRQSVNNKNLKRSQKMQLWTKFKKKFLVKRYFDLPEAELEKALSWLSKQ